jgi:hypothetical protein
VVRTVRVAIVVAVLLVAAMAPGIAGATSPLRTAFDQPGQRIPASTSTGMGYFGYDVALSEDGNTAIAGAFGDGGAGSAAVFTRSGSSFVQQGPKIPAPAAGSFARSVALSADGNIALIGADRESSDAGAAYVFTRSGSTWTQTARLTPTDETGAGSFGYSVALSADGATAVIGGPSDDNTGMSVGAAWVFTRSGTTWTQQGSKLVPNDATGGADAGQAVAVSDDGNTALIGGPIDHTVSGGSVGAAWVFTRSMLAWSQQGSKLTPTTTTTASAFGSSVALSADGDRAMVGAPFDGNAGAAWPFVRSSGIWSHEGSTKLTPSDSTTAHFGWSVALTNDATSASIGGIGDNALVGAAWAFSRSGSTWSQDGLKVTGNGEVGSGEFGESTALSANGGTALVGAGYDSGPGAPPPGAIWAFGGSGSSLQFSTDQYSVSESVAAGHSTVTVQRSGPSTGQVSVHYATSDGSASSGTDYTSTSGTLTWADGDTADKTFDIPITNDGTHENAETVSLTLSSPGGKASLGTQSTATLTINDDDPPAAVHFSASTYSANESDGTVLIHVQRDAPATGTASVHFATSDGTATDGADYTGGSGTVSFNDGETQQALSLAINDDGLHESDETLQITLSNPAVSTQLGSPSTATITITDDDPIDTSITGGPSGPTNDSTPTFTFAADPPANASFACWLDDGSPEPCSSPLTTVPLTEGGHTLHVRANNSTDTDPSPATRAFFVDTVPPTTTASILPGISGERIGSGETYAGNVFMLSQTSDPDPSSGLAETRCVLDPPAAPANFDALPTDECPLIASSAGDHTYYIASRDNAGNAQTPRAYHFTILPSPDTTITSGPTGFTASVPTFTFKSDTAGATFECHIDSEDWSPCKSPTARHGLSLAPHTFFVRAVGSTGAHDPSPASRSFTLGETSVTRTCDIRVAWIRDAGPVQICPMFKEPCPAGSKCTLRGSILIAADDIGVDYYGNLQFYYHNASDRRALGSAHCESNPEIEPVNARDKPCPQSGSGSHLGDGRDVEAECQGSGDAYLLNGGVKRGPDESRVLICRATLTIRPASAFEPVVAGTTVQTFVPIPGTIRVASPTLGRPRLVAAAAKRKKRVPLLAPVKVNVKKPGVVNIPIKLIKSAKRTLARRHKLPLTIRISFLAKGAKKPTMRSRRITLTTSNQPHCKPTKRTRCRKP